VEVAIADRGRKRWRCVVDARRRALGSFGVVGWGGGLGEGAAADGERIGRRGSLTHSVSRRRRP
jgi:hypothetical protein